MSFRDDGKWAALTKSGRLYNRIVSTPDCGVAHLIDVLDGYISDEDNSDASEKKSVLKAILQPSKSLCSLLEEDYI